MTRFMMAHLGVLLLLLAGTAAARPLQDQTSDYDYLLLVRQWPGTFCADSRSNNACPLLKHRDLSRFTIHGLWPNRQDGSWPEFCDSSQPFDAELLDDLRSDLDEEWPSFQDSTSSENFWAHEWNKHGTCAEDQLGNEHDFFKTVLQLSAQYDLKAALDSHNIQPSPDTVYAKKDLVAAFKDAFGVELLLHCSTRNQGLTEVWMCFDKQLQPIDCQVTRQEEQHCQHIKIAPFPSGPAAIEGLQSLQQGINTADETVDGHTAVSDACDPDHDHDSGDDEDDTQHRDEQRHAQQEQEEGKREGHEEKEEKEGEAVTTTTTTTATAVTTADNDAVSGTPAASSRATAAEPKAAAACSSATAGKISMHQGQRVDLEYSTARTITIAAAGAVLASIILVTLVSSWASRATSHLDDHSHSHSSQPGSPVSHTFHSIIPDPPAHPSSPAGPDFRRVLILPPAATFDSPDEIHDVRTAARVEAATYVDSDSNDTELRRPLLDP